MSKTRAVYHKNLTVASGGTNSTACPCGCWAIASVDYPTITSTSVSYEVTNDVDDDGAPQNWAAAQDHEGSNVGSITIASNDTLPVHPEVLDARFFRVVMGSSEGADRTLKVTLKS